LTKMKTSKRFEFLSITVIKNLKKCVMKKKKKKKIYY
jgi:hypothetical protein